jgi:murein DD-endopeptidase MepM/ murein hydrolase activator NlpD
MRCRRVALLLVFIVVAGTAAVVPARAQTNSDRQRQLRGEIAEIDAEEAAAREVLAEIQARKGLVDARVAELDAQLATARARVVEAEADVARLTDALTAAQTRLVDTQAKLDAAKREVERSAAQMYRSARRGARFDYLSVERPDDLVHGAQYLDRVNIDQRNTMQRITTLRDQVAHEREQIALVKQQADAAALDAQRARDEIDRVRVEIEPVRVEAAVQAEAEAAQLAALAAKRQQAQQELEAVSAAIAAELQRVAAASGPMPALGGAGCDARPTSGSLTSRFGQRWGRLHAGIDVAAPTGTPIRACWPGRVVVAGWQGGYGNTVVIDHGGGRATLYAHQSSIAVSVGQVVDAGAVIGAVGSTGNSTGPHLHFEVRINGNPVDPAPYF